MQKKGGTKNIMAKIKISIQNKFDCKSLETSGKRIISI